RQRKGPFPGCAAVSQTGNPSGRGDISLVDLATRRLLSSRRHRFVELDSIGVRHGLRLLDDSSGEESTALRVECQNRSANREEGVRMGLWVGAPNWQWDYEVPMQEVTLT